MVDNKLASPRPARLVIVRHGSTLWSKSGQHTGSTDLELDDDGRAEARLLKERLAKESFAAVFTSPRLRARETCALAGLGDQAVIDDDLAEWDYGQLEGLTKPEIRDRFPGWQIFRDGAPGGETPLQVAARCDAFMQRVSGINGAIAVFSHGHLSRMLASRYVHQEPIFGQFLDLGTASISVLCCDEDGPSILHWNT